MSTILDPRDGAEHVVLSVVLPADLARALDHAAGELLSSRAGHARRLLAQSLRQSGHFTPEPSPKRRHCATA